MTRTPSRRHAMLRPLLAAGLGLGTALGALAAVAGTPAAAAVHITVPPLPPHNGTGQPGTTSPAPACDPRSHGYEKAGTPGVTPRAGSLLVTWTHKKDPDVTAYRVAAVPQKLRAGAQPALKWTTVKPPSGCSATVTVTIRGLARKAAYDVWLDVVVKRSTPSGGGTRDLNLGRSGVVWTR